MGLFDAHPARRRNPYRHNPYQRDDPADVLARVLAKLRDVEPLQDFLADVAASAALQAQLRAAIEMAQDRRAAEV